MDFAFYRNFITVAETGNLSAAAKHLASYSRRSARR